MPNLSFSLGTYETQRQYASFVYSCQYTFIIAFNTVGLLALTLYKDNVYLMNVLCLAYCVQSNKVVPAEKLSQRCRVLCLACGCFDSVPAIFISLSKS
jgi:hypothetical protein